MERKSVFKWIASVPACRQAGSPWFILRSTSENGSCHREDQKLLTNKLLLAGYFFLVFSLSSLLSADPAHAIRLTKVKHLFDLTHNFSQPSDVSVSGDGLIYVLDGVNSKVKVFDQKGKFLYSFGRKGDGAGKFDFPLGIDVDSSGRVYVADSGNQRVQVFNRSGGFISQFRLPSKSDFPAEPTDVVVNKDGSICYVIDNNRHHIVAYDLTAGKVIGTYGSPGTEKLQFRYPFLATRDREDYIYITDVVNTRVQVMNPDGKFVMEIGGWGVEKGEFFRPKGVAIDKKDRVFISDSYMGVVQVFEPDGDFYSVVGDSTGGAVKKFKSPVGIYIDSKNRLYVVEMFENKVSVYSIGRDTK